MFVISHEHQGFEWQRVMGWTDRCVGVQARHCRGFTWELGVRFPGLEWFGGGALLLLMLMKHRLTLMWHNDFDIHFSPLSDFHLYFTIFYKLTFSILPSLLLLLSFSPFCPCLSGFLLSPFSQFCSNFSLLYPALSPFLSLDFSVEINGRSLNKRSRGCRRWRPGFSITRSLQLPQHTLLWTHTHTNTQTCWANTKTEHSRKNIFKIEEEWLGCWKEREKKRDGGLRETRKKKERKGGENRPIRNHQQRKENEETRHIQRKDRGTVDTKGKRRMKINDEKREVRQWIRKKSRERWKKREWKTTENTETSRES